MRREFELEGIDTREGARVMTEIEERAGWAARREARNWRMLAAALMFAVFGLALVVAGLMMGGCTVAPKTVSANTASWDGTNQNSGIVWVVTADGRRLSGKAAEANKGPIQALIISEAAAERYNGLVMIYGNRFVPPVKKDDGLSGPVGTDQGRPTWRMTPEAAARWLTMQRWRREGK